MLDGNERSWMDTVIRHDEVEPYLENGRDFIDDARIRQSLAEARPDPLRVREIVAKARGLGRLELEEAATLLAVPSGDPLWDEINAAALAIKETVYGRRIVTFAPLYLSNHCVNDCEYCGYRRSHGGSDRHRLDDAAIEAEVRALVKAGHKRLVMVYGEHPLSGADYIEHTMRLVYSIQEGNGSIRRANINAAPLSIADLKKLKEAGIGTFQVFQETYDREVYARVHPTGTLKADFQWRLTAQHRGIEAGCDDVAIGALFGLADWKFEVLGLLSHAISLEQRFGGIGPHTISFPRLEPAPGTPFASDSPNLVSDDEFVRAVAVLRLAVPYTGMILTCREKPAMRERLLELGVTQLDFGSNIGVGAYSKDAAMPERQQFYLSDGRSLDEGVGWLAEHGRITSFCTADYRLGRTGHCFMKIAQSGQIHSLCTPNAVLTYAEYLLDYASPEVRKAGEPILERELAAVTHPELRAKAEAYLARIRAGERDLYM